MNTEQEFDLTAAVKAGARAMDEAIEIDRGASWLTLAKAAHDAMLPILRAQFVEEVAGVVNVELIAKICRDHVACTWVVPSTKVGPVWSCGIIHQPTTRDRHMAALVMTQIEADRVVPALARNWGTK